MHGESQPYGGQKLLCSSKISNFLKDSIFFKLDKCHLLSSDWGPHVYDMCICQLGFMIKSSL